MAGSLEKKLETVLVVDDTPLVVNVLVNILKDANFNVLPASSGLDALKLATDYPGRIDLLLSDAKMPGMSGPDLGEFLKKTRPDMHLLFMSGFTGETYWRSTTDGLTFKNHSSQSSWWRRLTPSSTRPINHRVAAITTHAETTSQRRKASKTRVRIVRASDRNHSRPGKCHD